MTKEQYSIGELSKISGLSIRTLQHYDDINLLASARNDNGKRIYDEKDLHLLEQIIFYKLLDFQLKDIKNNLDQSGNPENFKSILQKQQLLILQKIEHLNTSFLILELMEDRLNQGHTIDLAYMITQLKIAPDDDVFSQISMLDQRNWQFDQNIHKSEVIHFYQEWKRCLMKANLLMYEEVDYRSEEAQELASDWWKTILTLTDEDRQVIEQIAHQNLLSQLSLGNNENIKAASDFLGYALDYYLKNI